jgi:hypothetical protein
MRTLFAQKRRSMCKTSIAFESRTTTMRTERRPRRYVARHWFLLLRPLLVYNFARDAYLLRGVGRHYGPVLRRERRMHRERDRRPWLDRTRRELPGLEASDRAAERRWVKA